MSDFVELASSELDVMAAAICSLDTCMMPIPLLAIAWLVPLVGLLLPGVAATSTLPTPPYTPTWTSLDTRSNPPWYEAARVGIKIHWGKVGGWTCARACDNHTCVTLRAVAAPWAWQHVC